MLEDGRPRTDAGIARMLHVNSHKDLLRKQEWKREHSLTIADFLLDSIYDDLTPNSRGRPVADVTSARDEWLSPGASSLKIICAIESLGLALRVILSLCEVIGEVVYDGMFFILTGGSLRILLRLILIPIQIRARTLPILLN